MELWRLHGHVGRNADGPLLRGGRGAGISNLQSYYGENKVDQSLIPFMGASVYDDPAVYLKSFTDQFY
jgi:hypothetical protein